MNRHRQRARRQPASTLRAVTSALTLVLVLVLSAPPASATGISSVRGRAGTLYDFEGINARALVVTLEPDDWPAIFRRDGDVHYEVGVLRLPDVDRGDALYGVHFSPSWRFAPDALAPYAFLEFGVGATWLSGRRIRARDLGSRLHFVSHVLLGFRLARRSPWHAGLRIRHTSNADLASPNPGFDVIQFELGYRFGTD